LGILHSTQPPAAHPPTPSPRVTPPVTTQAAGDITYSIVRPTAFFKSLAGQVELVKQGKPYVMFGDGTLASCKPISEADLAAFMADCVTGEGLVCVWGGGGGVGCVWGVCGV
jgi:divinyl chlorophyllide a 8-vinyl-reductase